MAYGLTGSIVDIAGKFAGDAIGAGFFSRVKLAFGIEGAATDVSAVNPLPVSLSDANLAALEQITAALSAGTIVAIDAASLTALEQITASLAAGTVVGLDGASLAALENITASLAAGATVALDAAALAALESITIGTPLPAGTNRIGGVGVQGTGVVYFDRSGAIAAGGAQQQLAAANAARLGMWLQNTSAGDLRVSSRGNAAAAAGILVKSGDLFVWPAHGTPIGSISVWGATIGQSFEAAEW